MDSFCFVQCADAAVLAQRCALFVLGILVFFNLICTANYMPEESPFMFYAPVAFAAGGAVMIVHGAVFNQIQSALWAGAVTAGLLTILMLTLWLEGYHVSKHIRQIQVMKQLIEAAKNDEEANRG